VPTFLLSFQPKTSPNSTKQLDGRHRLDTLA
jgi:hypothetical protein